MKIAPTVRQRLFASRAYSYIPHTEWNYFVTLLLWPMARRSANNGVYVDFCAIEGVGCQQYKHTKSCQGDAKGRSPDEGIAPPSLVVTWCRWCGLGCREGVVPLPRPCYPADTMICHA